MKGVVLCLLLFALPLMAGSPGIRPRADAASYPVHLDGPGFSIGAYLVPPAQVKKMFKLDLNRAGYVVIEVGVFPAPEKNVDLFPTDFMLSVGDKVATVRPVDADTVAEVLMGRPEPPHVPSSLGGINTSIGASVGRVSYPDPVTGRRTSGTITDTEVGVGVGGPAPLPCRGYNCDTTSPPVYSPSPTQNTNAASQDLWEKSLPDGKTAHPVAGYLYFPKPSKKAKDATWELRYENADGKTRLQLTR